LDTEIAPSLPAGRHPEFRRGWKVLVASLLGVACGASPLPYSTMGFFLGPLHAEFGWTFAQASFGLTIYGIIGALLAPYFGSLGDRYGVRRVALLSTLAFGLVFASLAITPASLTGFYAIWVVIGLVGIGSTPVTWSRAVNLWFFRNRGLALGMVLVGTALAAVVLPQLCEYYIGHFGWRKAFALLALLPLCVALPVGLLWFREPRPEERPPGMSAAGSEGALAGLTLREAVRGYRFWALLASILIVSTAYGGAHVHFFEMMKMHGISADRASNVFSFLGLSIMLARVGAGFLLDRFWAPIVTLPLLALPAAACWLLTGETLSVPVAFLCAGLLGLASGAETDLVAYFASRYFGMAHYGKIYGVLYMTFGIGSAISPPLYGRVRDLTGNYDLALRGAAVAFVVGGLILLMMGGYRRATRSWNAAAIEGLQGIPST
jgi:MFS family permease